MSEPLKIFTRRDLLRGAGLAGAAAVAAPASLLTNAAPAEAAPPQAASTRTAAAPAREAFENLTDRKSVV